MSAKKTEPAEKSLVLLKIPYVYEDGTEFDLLPVANPQAAGALVTAEKNSENYGKYYYVLIQGSVVPTAQWIADEVQIFHP